MDIQKLLEYKTLGWIESQSHPNYPNLQIFNYSRKAQYSGYWDEITLNTRGLIIDLETNKIIATGFPKFFNIEEHNWIVPVEKFDVFCKEDGSLGICFYYNGKWHLATRGSFASDQAIEGKRILDDKYGHLYPVIFDKNSCYLFEIIYPENRIVVDYKGLRDLIMICKYQISPVIKELDIFGYQNLSFSVVKQYNGILDIRKLKDLNLPNSEGFVLRFHTGQRVKIKFEEYVKLHAILTNISTISIWEQLKNGKLKAEILDLIEVDELHDEVGKYIDFLRTEHLNILNTHLGILGEICYKLKISEIELESISREMKKELALEIKEYPEQSQSILFSLAHNPIRAYHLIWDLIRPEYKKII